MLKIIPTNWNNSVYVTITITSLLRVRTTAYRFRYAPFLIYHINQILSICVERGLGFSFVFYWANSLNAVFADKKGTLPQKVP